MGRIDKIYFRKTRDDLGRYPNWPINQKIGVGKIGLLSGRNAKFEWITTLDELGVNFETNSPQSFISELYTSMNGVAFCFKCNMNTQLAQAEFSFAKGNSVATQGHQVVHKNINLKKLKTNLIDSINNGLNWNYKWVIISEIWLAEGFTTLISAKDKSKTGICTSVKTNSTAFNIADFNLGLSVSETKDMAYQGIAERKVVPYFQIHRLTRDHKLKKYGKGMSYFK